MERRAEPAKAPLVHPPQRDHGNRQCRGDRPRTPDAQRARAGVRPGVVDWGQKHGVDPEPAGAPRLARIVHRAGAQPMAGRVVNTHLAPHPGVPRTQDDQLTATREPQDPPEQRAPIVPRKAVVAEHDPSAPRQPRDRAPQFATHAVIGHQPADRDGGGVAGTHDAAYSARMPADERLHAIRDRIARAAALRRGDAAPPTLIAVSKTHPVAAIRPLLVAGQRDFGENRVQEAQEKWPALLEAHPDARLHLIGQLQSNKARDAVELAHAIHAVDRASLVAALARAMEATGRRPDCFIQVNIGDEAQKGGCAVADLPALLAEARAAELPVSGLMCLPPAGVDAAPYFALLAKLARDNGLAGLSMGMSDDFETAAMLGATHVRVGSALFGARA